MKNTLIPMTQFVLRIKEIVPKEIGQDIDAYWLNKLIAIEKYAKLFSQNLTLGMFIPCNEDGEVLEEPKPFKDGDCEDQNRAVTQIRKDTYQAAKERVLFEGEFLFDEFEMHLKGNDDFFLDLLVFEEKSATINVEELADLGLVLTPSALKQIGINEIPELK